MSLQPDPIGPVPDEMARVARAAFPKGSRYLHMRDVLGTVFADADFADLYAPRGRPVEAPWRLALVTVMQFAEGLSDRQAAEAVRARIQLTRARRRTTRRRATGSSAVTPGPAPRSTRPRRATTTGPT